MVYWEKYIGFLNVDCLTAIDSISRITHVAKLVPFLKYVIPAKFKSQQFV